MNEGFIVNGRFKSSPVILKDCYLCITCSDRGSLSEILLPVEFSASTSLATYEESYELTPAQAKGHYLKCDNRDTLKVE